MLKLPRGMTSDGLSLACRYAYPPNSLSLCGPEKQTDLSWYTETQQTDQGSKEILQQFHTLYPYLCFIAGQNNLKDPFLQDIVEAYWIGNPLLAATKTSHFLQFIDTASNISKKNSRTNIEIVKEKIVNGAVPNHAFHVLNIYKRTGHIDEQHTVNTMDACIINAGEIMSIEKESLIVKTKPLQNCNGTISFGKPIHRKIRFQGNNDVIASTLALNDWITYHWGYVCQKISPLQRKNLSLYTNMALHTSKNTIFFKNKEAP